MRKVVRLVWTSVSRDLIRSRTSVSRDLIRSRTSVSRDLIRSRRWYRGG